jgi:hypothetical protein
LQTMQNIQEEIKYAHVCLPTPQVKPTSVSWLILENHWKDGLRSCCHLAYYSYLNKQTVCDD